ncbi:hypothetical protein G6F35_016724 [Rhizopus arrhizus]|nr:hypothetical protein G6F35_016724 [Rhizopus arrhizus]
MKDGRQRGFQVGQFGRGQRLGRNLELRVGLAGQLTSMPGLFRAIEENPAGVAQAMPGAAGVQQPQVFRSRQSDQFVQRRRGFLKDRRSGVQQKPGCPTQVLRQVAAAVAELDGVVLEQSGQLAPQAGMVERHQRTARQHAGVAQGRFHARLLPVDQGDGQ